MSPFEFSLFCHFQLIGVGIHSKQAVDKCVTKEDLKTHDGSITTQDYENQILETLQQLGIQYGKNKIFPFPRKLFIKTWY